MKAAKRLLIQVILLFLFLIASSVFLVYAKAKVTSYIEQVQAYAIQVHALEDTAATTEGLSKLEGILAAINPLLQKSMIFTFFIVPMILFLLWISLVGSTFYFANKKHKKSFKSYILDFAAISVLPFFGGGYILFKILQSSGILFTGGNGVITLAVCSILFLAIAYLTFISYALIGEYRLLQIPLKTLKAALMKIYILLPLFLLLMIVVTPLLSVTYSTYLSISKLELLTVYDIARTLIAYNVAILVVMLSATILLNNFLLRRIIKSFHSP